MTEITVTNFGQTRGSDDWGAVRLPSSTRGTATISSRMVSRRGSKPESLLRPSTSNRASSSLASRSTSHATQAQPVTRSCWSSAGSCRQRRASDIGEQRTAIACKYPRWSNRLRNDRAHPLGSLEARARRLQPARAQRRAFSCCRQSPAAPNEKAPSLSRWRG